MKKIFVRLCSIALIGLALTACNNDAANKAAADADNTAVDQIVQDKIKTLDDSLSKACDAQVTAAVDAKIDSLAKAGHKGAQAHVSHHSTTPATPAKKDDPKKPETKADKMGGTTAPGNNATDKASKMGGTGAPTAPGNDKASKMGGH